ncbi:MAG: hypothetical protein IRY94_20240 [Rhodospirillaceae bacterium]|nr:hypothetical protein [Rhodospirillaceae bacterium]
MILTSGDMTAEPAAERVGRPHGNPLLAIAPQLLAVELLLLAFFIVLNGASDFETGRSRAVIDSLHEALGIPGLDRGGTVRDEAAALARVENYVGHLAEALGGSRAGPSQSDALWIDLPVNAFFRPGEDRPNPAQAGFVSRLASLLAATPSGYGYEIAVLRGGADAAAGDLRLRQAGTLAAALRARSEPRAVVAAGTVPDENLGLRLAITWTARDEEGAAATPSRPAGREGR